MVQLDNINQKLREDGYVILENFYSIEEVQEMREAGLKIAEDIHANVDERVVFDGVKNSFAKNSYFEESADKISPFYDPKAMHENGQFKVDLKKSLARVGHALHEKHPVFNKYVLDERVRNVCKELKFEDPAVAISMYLYKNKDLSSGVDAHQESSFLYNDPTKLASFWVALDDISGIAADGCLRIIPKSHLDCLHSRYIRNEDYKSDERFVFDKPMPHFDEKQFVPINVKKGDIVVMDGKLVHKSDSNEKASDRHAFIFNVLEQKDSHYDERNWCQPKNGFMRLY